MNFTARPRHWLRFHIVANRAHFYATLYLGWGWNYRRWHFSRSRKVAS